MNTLENLESIKTLIETNFITVIIFSTKTCSICKPLKAKTQEALIPYPKVALGEVFIEDVASSKGEFTVYTAPITILFVDGKESKRYSAALNFQEFTATIQRFYKFIP